MNRKQLMTQNLIFVFVAAIIILILGFLVISRLEFLVKQINLSLKVGPMTTTEQSFNLDGLEAIKNKLPFSPIEITPIPTSTSTIPFSTSTIPFSTTTEPTIFPEILLEP